MVIVALDRLAIVNQCSTGPRPGRARQIDCNSRAGVAFEKRNTSWPLCWSKSPPWYCQLVGSGEPPCVTEGKSSSGTGAGSQFELSFAAPSWVSTAVPFTSATTTTVSSVLKRHDFALLEHQTRLLLMATHTVTTHKTFIRSASRSQARRLSGVHLVLSDLRYRL